MTILDKIMFWKKKDEFADMGLGDKEKLAFGDEFGAQPGAAPGTIPGADALGQVPGMPGQQPAPAEPSIPSITQPSYSPPPTAPFPPPAFPNPQADIESKNLEIISSKLDALRASIESLSQRMANLEALARGEEEQGRRRRYY